MSENNLRHSLKRLSERMRLASFLRETPEIPSFRGDLPPFYSALAAVNIRRRSWKMLFFASAGVLMTVVAFQQKVIGNKLFDKANEPFVIVPGAPEFTRIRPGQVPDESVFIFAEYVAANLGNFSWRNVRYHLGKVSAFMTPAMRGQFERDFEARAKEWVERRVDQNFAYEPVKQFQLQNDVRGQKYVVTVEGTRSQYVEGHVFLETKEFLNLVFRARGNLTPDRPFIFEIEDIRWLSPAQMDALRRALPDDNNEEKK